MGYTAPMTQPPDDAPQTLTVDGQDWPVAAVVEALAPHLLPARRARMDAVLAQRLTSVALGIEDLHHGYNGAACLRTAEGLGVQDVIAVEVRNALPLPVDPPRKITKSAHAWLDLHRVDRPEAALAWARARGMRVFGAGPRGERTLRDLPVDQPLLLLFGNEAEGLRAETLDACDDVFRIPMFGFTESFNVSVSVGMVLSDLTTRRRAALAVEGRAGDLPAARAQRLRALWYVQDLRGAGAILRRKLG